MRGLAVSENGLTLVLARRSARPDAKFRLRLPHPRRGGPRRARVRRRAHEADAPDRRPPRPDRFPAPSPDPASGRHLDDAAEAAARPGRTASSPTSPWAASRPRSPTTSRSDGTVRSRRAACSREGLRDGRLPRRPRPTAPSTAGEESELSVRRHPQRAAGLAPGLSRREGPPGRAARGRPRLPACPPRHPSASASRPTFPNAGTYRLFLQFQVGGRVHTAAFTLEVSR